MLCLSVLLVVVDNTIVNVALPTISRDLSASTGGLQWIVDAYTLTFAGLLLVGGNLGDRLGRRRMLQLGLALFAVTSVGAALSPDDRRADRGPGGHGRRRRAGLPGHAGPAEQRVHRRQGAGHRHRHLGRRSPAWPWPSAR